MLTRLEVEGFKSFGSPGISVELAPLNFIVGPNASGKTNTISALRFLQNAVRQSAEFAVNDLGGISEVRNKRQRERKEPKDLRIRVHLNDNLAVRDHSETASQSIGNFDYTLVVRLRAADEVPTIVSESLRADCTKGNTSAVYRLDRDLDKLMISDPFSPTQAEGGNVRVPEKERSRPALAAGFYSLPLVLLRDIIMRWSFFNISPQVAKQPYKEVPEAALGPFGENLSVVLHELQGDKKNTNRLGALMANLQGAIPGFKGFDVVRDRYEAKCVLQLTEEHIRTAINPSSISDGTIRLLALMTIANLGAEKEATLIAIEEPENGIHPHLAEHLVDIFRETSQNAQILATTHNPAFLDHLEPSEVLLCGKTDGFTRIQRAADLAEIRSFQKHFTLGELYVQGKFDELFQ